MKILVVNPNTSRSMTDTIARTARRAATTGTEILAVQHLHHEVRRPVPEPAHVGDPGDVLSVQTHRGTSLAQEPLPVLGVRVGPQQLDGDVLGELRVVLRSKTPLRDPFGDE